MTKSKKIRIYPTKEQKILFKQWFGIARLVYNKTIDYLNNIIGTRPKWTDIANNIIHALSEHEYVKIVPYQIKKIAVKDSCDALTTNKIKTKITGKSFNLKFKSRKAPIQSCYIPKSAIKKGGIYYTISGDGLKFSEQLPEDIGDCRLVFNNGRYYLCIPCKEKIMKSENQGRIVAIDPGIRTFITFFSESSFGKMGEYSIGRIQRLCYYLDDLISRTSNTKNFVKKCRMKKAQKRIRWKLSDLIDELHHKAARFLLTNFDIVFLPSFETSNMCRKAKRKLHKKSVRQMLTLAHYRFKQFIKHKAFELGKIIIDCNEAYTSKTNSWTGEIIHNLGGRKFIKMDNLRIDRDINGARGIFLRALRDLSRQSNFCLHY